ncbi:hypothetical protein NC652_014821 [Populus alba x Populus x berolinensis]|nr:hypothetical protein NC652_014821 [Populus alba x Populus x berolinensis]
MAVDILQPQSSHGLELRICNFEHLERPPYVVVLNKIDLPEVHMQLQPFVFKRLPFRARNRLPSLTEEISRNGCEEVPSEPKMITNKDKRDREIEDYPCPLAVVGVSVL